jgi:PIN domain nuclease of toxin-antitoxin system
VRLLLDTSLIIQIMQGREIKAAARQTIADADEVFVSAVCIWEIAIKAGIGKLRVDFDEMLAQLPRDGFRELPVRWRHARVARDLPHHHRDPFDRLLVSQAIDEAMQFMTQDTRLRRYSDLVVLI